jgi:hypothetical protein
VCARVPRRYAQASWTLAVGAANRCEPGGGDPTGGGRGHPYGRAHGGRCAEAAGRTPMAVCMAGGSGAHCEGLRAVQAWACCCVGVHLPHPTALPLWCGTCMRGRGVPSTTSRIGERGRLRVQQWAWIGLSRSVSWPATSGIGFGISCDRQAPRVLSSEQPGVPSSAIGLLPVVCCASGPCACSIAARGRVLTERQRNVDRNII